MPGLGKSGTSRMSCFRSLQFSVVDDMSYQAPSMPNDFASRNGAGDTATSSTRAARGPSRRRPCRVLSCSRVPVAITSTLPLSRLRTQPVMPNCAASRSTNQRKPTPCTRPETRYRRVSRSSLMKGKIQDKRLSGPPQPVNASDVGRGHFRIAPNDDMVFMRSSPLLARRGIPQNDLPKGRRTKTPCCTPRELLVYSHPYFWFSSPCLCGEPARPTTKKPFATPLVCCRPCSPPIVFPAVCCRRLIASSFFPVSKSSLLALVEPVDAAPFRAARAMAIPVGGRHPPCTKSVVPVLVFRSVARPATS